MAAITSPSTPRPVIASMTGFLPYLSPSLMTNGVSRAETKTKVRPNQATCVVWKLCATLAVALAPRMPAPASN